MILITAAGGKVGRAVTAQLSRKGVRARAGFHSEAKARAFALPGLEAVALDLEKPATLAPALHGVTKVFLATTGSPAQPAQETNLIEAAKAAGVKHIVKLSVMHAETEAFSFARWNRVGEKALAESGIAYTLLRPNSFMDNLLGSAEGLKAQGGFTSGPAARRLAVIDARDIAAMAVAALTEAGHAGQTYDVNGPELLDGPSQAAIFAKVLHRPVTYFDVSAAEFVKQLGGHGLPGWLVEAYGELAAADTTPFGAQSSADVERVLGRRPGTLEQFVRDHAAAFGG